MTVYALILIVALCAAVMLAVAALAHLLGGVPA